MGILLLRVPVRCDVIWTVIFAGVKLFGLILRVAVVRQWFNVVFVIRWLTLLYRWVYMIIVSAEVGFGAAFTPPLWLPLKGTTLRCILPFLVVVLFGCIHHIHIVCGGGRPTPGKRLVLALFVSGTVVHVVDVFGGVIHHVG